MKKPTARCIMVQGTASHAGKSVLVGALCRILVQDGYKVAPFKAQNMSLNSFATQEGGEIGRAQAMQAEAAKIKPAVDMNPILLKPTGQMGSQVIIHGKPWVNMQPKEYYSNKSKLLKAVTSSLNRLRSQYEIIVIEGAGSPAEINLRKSDIVNMKVAKLANAPVILIGDIDRGGVFASFVGTLELLTNSERHRIKGLIINKFRGDANLLKPGLDFIEKKTKKPLLGVLPYFTDIHIDQEDSVWFDDINVNASSGKSDRLDIAVVHLPHTSNFTDFDPLTTEPDVSLRYATSAEDLKHPDCIIIPGTKNTIEDLMYIKDNGIFKKIESEVKSGKTVVGICGGFQMLGKEIRDPHQIESNRGGISGFGLLEIITTLEPQKSTCQAKAVPYFDEDIEEIIISGYEIHHGKTEFIASASDSTSAKNTIPLLKIIQRSGQSVDDVDGAVALYGSVWGTYLHGIFDNDRFRRKFLNHLRQKRGWNPLKASMSWNKDKEYDKLANLVRANIQIDKVYQILFSN